MADTADLVVLGAYIGTGNKGKHLFTLHQIFVQNDYFAYYTIMMKYLLCLFILVLFVHCQRRIWKGSQNFTFNCIVIAFDFIWLSYCSPIEILLLFLDPPLCVFCCYILTVERFVFYFIFYNMK